MEVFVETGNAALGVASLLMSDASGVGILNTAPRTTTLILDVGEEDTVTGFLESVAAQLWPFCIFHCVPEDIIIHFADATLTTDNGLISTTALTHGETVRVGFNAERIIALIMEQRVVLSDLPEWARCDHGVVLAVVAQRGAAGELGSAHWRLRGDEDFMKKAAALQPVCVEFASEELRADRGFMWAAIKRAPMLLQHASEELRGDRDIVLSAVQRRGEALQYAADGMKADRGIVKAALQKDNKAIQYASETLRRDSSIVALVSPVWGRTYGLGQARPTLAAVRHHMDVLRGR